MARPKKVVEGTGEALASSSAIAVLEDAPKDGLFATEDRTPNQLGVEGLETSGVGLTFPKKVLGYDEVSNLSGVFRQMDSFGKWAQADFLLYITRNFPDKYDQLVAQMGFGIDHIRNMEKVGNVFPDHSVRNQFAELPVSFFVAVSGINTATMEPRYTKAQRIELLKAAAASGMNTEQFRDYQKAFDEKYGTHGSRGPKAKPALLPATVKESLTVGTEGVEQSEGVEQAWDEGAETDPEITRSVNSVTEEDDRLRIQMEDDEGYIDISSIKGAMYEKLKYIADACDTSPFEAIEQMIEAQYSALKANED